MENFELLKQLSKIMIFCKTVRFQNFIFCFWTHINMKHINMKDQCWKSVYTKLNINFCLSACLSDL